MRPSGPAGSVVPGVFSRVPVPAAPAPRPSVRASWAREGWTSPRTLTAFLLASLVGSVLLFAVGMVAYSQLRDNAREVGRDSVPSILAALQIQASLVDMDANAANDLLAGAAGSRTARDSFEAQRSIIGRQIVAASQNITYGNAERVPLDTLQDGMTYYTQLIAQARAQLRENPNDQNRMPYASTALNTYRQASEFLRATLVPAAQRLGQVNGAALDRAYSDSAATTTLMTGLLLVAGLALLAALVGAQVYLSRRTRRLLNLPLLAASVAVVAYLLFALNAAGTQREALRAANRDAFVSLNVLWKARIEAYDANGDQSLALLDATNAARYTQQFNEKTGRVVSQPVTTQVEDAARNGRVTFTGYLADELRNITFPSERDAALATLSEFGGYQRSNAEIQRLNAAGMRDAALARATGTNTDQSRRSFERFDAALTRTIAINQTGFDGVITRAFAVVEPLQWLAPLVAGIVALLAFAGLQPRLREYAV